MTVNQQSRGITSIDSVTQKASTSDNRSQESILYCRIEQFDAIIAGPILGLAPAEKQIEMWHGNIAAARYMSTTSRISNAVWGAYALVSLGTRTFGYDIDLSPANLATWVGLGVAAQVAVRECVAWAAYRFKHPDGSRFDPIGDPILEVVHFSKEVPLW
jgi:hypothetical protein